MTHDEVLGWRTELKAIEALLERLGSSGGEWADVVDVARGSESPERDRGLSLAAPLLILLSAGRSDRRSGLGCAHSERQAGREAAYVCTHVQAAGVRAGRQ